MISPKGADGQSEKLYNSSRNSAANPSKIKENICTRSVPHFVHPVVVMRKSGGARWSVFYRRSALSVGIGYR